MNPLSRLRKKSRADSLLILISVALAVWHSPWWLLLTVLIGLNMLQAAFTGFCPAAKVFAGMGVKPGKAFE